MNGNSNNYQNYLTCLETECLREEMNNIHLQGLIGFEFEVEILHLSFMFRFTNRIYHRGS